MVETTCEPPQDVVLSYTDEWFLVDPTTCTWQIERTMDGQRTLVGPTYSGRVVPQIVEGVPSEGRIVIAQQPVSLLPVPVSAAPPSPPAVPRGPQVSAARPSITEQPWFWPAVIAGAALVFLWRGGRR